MAPELNGKVAIVTGAGRGMGRAHALSLAAAGAAVVVNDLGAGTDGTGANSGPANEVVEEIHASGGMAIADFRDISSWDSAALIVDAAVGTFGRLDIVINNAGISTFGPLDQETESGWHRTMDVNFNGPAGLMRSAVRHWRAAGPEAGRAIVNISSPGGAYPIAGLIGYCVAKAALNAMTIVSADEVAELGIRINAVAPMASTRLTELARPFVPPSLITTAGPSQVSNLVRYLVSPSCDFTGRVFGVEADNIYLFSGFDWHQHFSNDGHRWSVESLKSILATVDRQDHPVLMLPSAPVVGSIPGEGTLAALKVAEAS